MFFNDARSGVINGIFKVGIILSILIIAIVTIFFVYTWTTANIDNYNTLAYICSTVFIIIPVTGIISMVLYVFFALIIEDLTDYKMYIQIDIMNTNEYHRYELMTICYIFAYILSVIGVFIAIGGVDGVNMIEYINLHFTQTIVIIVTSMIGSSLIARNFIKNVY